MLELKEYKEVKVDLQSSFKREHYIDSIGVLLLTWISMFVITIIIFLLFLSINTIFSFVIIFILILFIYYFIQNLSYIF